MSIKYQHDHSPIKYLVFGISKYLLERLVPFFQRGQRFRRNFHNLGCDMTTQKIENRDGLFDKKECITWCSKHSLAIVTHA